MKKLMAVLILTLMIIFSCQAFADTQPISYTVDDLSFTPPSEFMLIEKSEDSMIFMVKFSSAQLRVALLPSEGLSLENVGRMMQYSLGVNGFEYDATAIVNDLPYVDCTFADESVPVDGKAALFVDNSKETVYVFFYQNKAQLSENEMNSWQKLLESVRSPEIFLQTLK